MDRADDHALIIESTREAGAMALRYFKSDLKAWDKSPNNPVSEADLAVDAYLKETLISARPDYGWLSEESEDDPERLNRARVFVVDPIDGTRAFIAGRPHFAISVALVENGEVIAGAVFNPATDEFFEAQRGGGARLNGAPIQVGTRDDFDGARMLGNRNFFTSRKVWPLPWPPMKFEGYNSIAYRIALVAADKADIMVTLKPKCDWDIAAAHLILEEAGGVCLAKDGLPPRYNAAQPEHPFVIATQKSLAADALHRVEIAFDNWRRT